MIPTCMILACAKAGAFGVSEIPRAAFCSHLTGAQVRYYSPPVLSHLPLEGSGLCRVRP